jgi:hypothetical protein
LKITDAFWLIYERNENPHDEGKGSISTPEGKWLMKSPSLIS